jgi:hypothetical protein
MYAVLELTDRISAKTFSPTQQKTEQKSSELHFFCLFKNDSFLSVSPSLLSTVLCCFCWREMIEFASLFFVVFFLAVVHARQNAL